MTEKMTKSFIADEIDQKIIAMKAQSMGDASDSAAIRAILREWNDLYTAARNSIIAREVPPAPAKEG